MLCIKSVVFVAFFQLGQTALHIATVVQNVDIVLLLISAGANINQPGPCLSTSLHLAANANSRMLVSLLLNYGAVATAALDDGTTALHCACQTSDGSNVASILLEHDASLLCKTRENNAGITGVTALHDAVEFADLRTVRVLLKHKVDVDAVTSAGTTALHLAAKHGYTDIVTELVRLGARVDVLASDVKGSCLCPLHCAVENGHLAVASRLLHAGADVNFACSYCGRERVTCLHIAAVRQNVEMVRLLLAAPGVDVSVCDNDGAAALHVAARGGFTDITELLLAHGADVNIGMTSGQSTNQTALHCSVRYRHVELACLLLAAGADVNATEKMAASTLPSGNK